MLEIVTFGLDQHVGRSKNTRNVDQTVNGSLQPAASGLVMRQIWIGVDTG
jgi:hypothetical protein